jgi:hypothetical protein
MKKTILLSFILFIAIIASCKKEKVKDEVDPSEKLAIDSIVATKLEIIIWEEIFITAYTRGENLSYKWSTNHGSMAGVDSATVKYWACPSCSGLNTIRCEVSNEHGMVSDTIMINVLFLFE